MSSLPVDAPGDWLAAYEPAVGGYDEMVGRDGRIRPAWVDVASSLGAMGVGELKRRRSEAGRMLRNDGASYNVYGQGVTHVSDWGLDPIPLVLGSEEWAAIERGIIQRAELLSLVLADLYGPRDLIKRGLIPIEVVAGHRGFLRACDQVVRPGEQALFSYACDLARDIDGQMWVLGDFAQAPSGAGYALENRNVTSRVFPSLYREAQVHRLAPFFRAMRSGVSAAAPDGVEDPRIAMLTPGAFSETYFEHALLATHLGYPLVEGSDLTVRDGRLWLRSLTGLAPVDVIVRRVDGWYCDPLELKSNSRLGVAGLVEVARRGRVGVVNPFGASVLENPGLLPFLPTVAVELLGEALELPAPYTWWCGAAADRSHVLANLESLVIKPIARSDERRSVFGWELTADQAADLRARIEASPVSYVAQEPLRRSSAPCLTSDGIEARQIVLRSFAVADRDTYQVMAGGLAGVDPLADGQGWSARADGVSKDTWVLASEPEPQSGFWLRRDSGSGVSPPLATMPARAAENLFWMGRYAERAESAIRLSRSILDRRNEFFGAISEPGQTCVSVLVDALASSTSAFGVDQSANLISVLGDPTRSGSLAFTLQALLSSIQAVRDQLSSDTWLVVAGIEQQLSVLDDPSATGDEAVPVALADLMRSLLALHGLGAESMVRDAGWQFLDVGRRLERAMLLANLVRRLVVPVRSVAVESLLLESLLVTGESIITYRRRYRSRAHVATVLDLLLVETDNPRSLAFQLDQLSDGLAALPRATQTRLSEEERMVLEATTMLRVADTSELSLASDVDSPQRAALDDLLLSVETLLSGSAMALEQANFAPLQVGRIVMGATTPLGALP